ncbi:MAG: hypothetical protein ONB52_22025, partial [candidate division KSB1 bacterium]|nr:hypothetical protein [candidate division KSB1 bacterium]
RVIELLAHFRELVYEHAVQPAIDAGLVSPRHLATITRNRETYVPFQVVDYYHGYVPPGIMAQYGTVKGIVNPLQSYTLKALALRRLAVQNRLRRGFMEVLVNTPSFTSPEDYGPEVPVVSGVRPNPRPGYSAIWYAKDGMWYFREVESWLAASLERTPLGLAHSLARWFNSFSYGLFHPLLVVWRAAFTARNVLVRDPWRNLRNMAAVISETKGTSPFVASFMSFWFLLRGYAKTFGPAFRSAALGSYEDVVIQALQEGALPARFFISGALADQGYLTIDELAEKTGLFVGPKVEPVSAAVRRVLRSSGLLGGPIRALALLGSHFWKNVLPKFPALSWLARAGMMGEVWHKLGPWYVLKHYLPSLEPSQRAYITLNLFGTPNPAQAGVFPEGWNLALGYGAVAWSGLRTDLGLYGSPRTRAGVLFMDSVVLFLRLLTLAALLGYLGEELREMYRHIPDWVKANRLVIPLGWVGSGSERRVRYIAIPVADVYRGPWTLLYWLGVHSARLATAPFKYLTRSFGAFKREEFPGLNPMLDLVRKWVSFMSGVNPPDELSGRPVVPQRTFEAGDFGSFRQMLYATLYDFGVVADVTMAAARLVPITGFEEELVPYRPREFDDLLFTVLNAATGMVDESRRGLDDEIAREVEWLETVGVQFPVSRPVRQALRRRYQLSRLGPGRRTPEQQDELNGLNDWYRDYYLPWRDIWFLADSLGDSGWKEKAMEELKESTKLIAPSVGRLRPPARPPALRTVPGPRSRLVPR